MVEAERTATRRAPAFWVSTFAGNEDIHLIRELSKPCYPSQGKSSFALLVVECVERQSYALARAFSGKWNPTMLKRLRNGVHKLFLDQDYAVDSTPVPEAGLSRKLRQFPKWMPPRFVSWGKHCRKGRTELWQPAEDERFGAAFLDHADLEKPFQVDCAKTQQ